MAEDDSPGPGPLPRHEALELLALGEVIARKAGYGRQLTVRSALVKMSASLEESAKSPLRSRILLIDAAMAGNIAVVRDGTYVCIEGPQFSTLAESLTYQKLGYAVNRYRREIERHYEVLDKHLKGRDFLVANEYSIVDISAWGWLDRAPRVLPGDTDPLQAFPDLQRWFRAIDSRPAVAKDPKASPGRR